MGQEHGQAAHPVPLGVATADELVNNHLGAVHKIPELGFPDDQGAGLGGGIAVLEPKNRLFGQQGIDNQEFPRIIRHVL